MKKAQIYFCVAGVPGRGPGLIGLQGEANCSAKGKGNQSRARIKVASIPKKWLTGLNKCHDLHTEEDPHLRVGTLGWLGAVKLHPPVVT